MGDSIGDDSLEGLLTLGSYLVRHHRDHCKHGVLVDTPEDIDNLESWFKASALQKGMHLVHSTRSRRVGFVGRRAIELTATAQRFSAAECDEDRHPMLKKFEPSAPLLHLDWGRFWR